MSEPVKPNSLLIKPLVRFSIKLQELAKSKHAAGILALISFTEALLPLPILTDPFLVTAVLLDRTRVWKMVAFTTASSVIGGFVAYLIAAFFKDSLLGVLSPEMLASLNSFAVEEQGTFLLTIVGAVTPIPYTIVAWAVALSSGHPIVFIIASIIGRSFRYGVVGWSTYKFGPAALQYARRSILLTSLIIFAIVALYIWLKL